MRQGLLQPPQSEAPPVPTTAAQPTGTDQPPPMPRPEGPRRDKEALLGPPPGEEPQEERDPLDPAVYFDGGDATPEEQRQFDAMTSIFMKAIHGKKTRKKVARAIEEAPQSQVPRVIGQQALGLFTVAENKLREAGMDVQDSVRMEAGQDLLEELLQVAVLVGQVPDDEEAVGQVMAEALDYFASRYGKAQADRGGRDKQADLMHMSELLQVADRRFPMKEVAAGVQAAQMAEGQARAEAEGMEDAAGLLAMQGQQGGSAA